MIEADYVTIPEFFGMAACDPQTGLLAAGQAVGELTRDCGLSHENEPPSIPLFNLVAPHMQVAWQVSPCGNQVAHAEVLCRRRRAVRAIAARVN
jgi:hypothetical protein